MKKKDKIEISVKEYEKLIFMKDFLIKHFTFLHNPDLTARIIFHYWDWGDDYEEYGASYVKGLDVRESHKLQKDIEKLNEYMKEEKK